MNESHLCRHPRRIARVKWNAEVSSWNIQNKNPHSISIIRNKKYINFAGLTDVIRRKPITSRPNDGWFMIRTISEGAVDFKCMKSMLTLDSDDDDDYYHRMAFEDSLMTSLNVWSEHHEAFISIFSVGTWHLTLCHMCQVQHFICCWYIVRSNGT